MNEESEINGNFYDFPEEIGTARDSVDMNSRENKTNNMAFNKTS